MRVGRMGAGGATDARSGGRQWYVTPPGAPPAPGRQAAHACRAHEGGTAGGHILVLSIVPERNFAIGILTNAQNGWRLIQDVEREALRSYHGIVYRRNQAIAHRGLVETLPDVEPLARQPDLRPYVGRYQRPMNAVDVRIDGGALVVQELPNSGDPRPAMPIAFFGPDRAVVTDGNDRGQSIEFVRDGSGTVKWVRVVGRVAVRN